MSFKLKLFLFTGIMIFIIVVSYWLIYFEQSEVVEPGREVEQESLDLLKNIEFVLYNDNKTFKWNLMASEVIRILDREFIDLSVLDIDVFSYQENTNSEEKLLYNLEAPQGKYWNYDNILYLDGPVNIEKNNYIMTSGNLEWKQNKDILTGGEGFKLETPSFILEGENFESDLSLDEIIVSGKESRAHLKWKEN